MVWKTQDDGGQEPPSARPRPSGRPGLTPVKSEELGDVAPRPGETERQAKVRAMTERIRSEARKAREEATMTETQREAKRKQSDVLGLKRREEEDGQKLEVLVPQLESKVSGTEEEAEKVSILAAPLSMEASEELRALQRKAVTDVEKHLRVAMAAALAAKRELDKRRLEAESMAPQAREYAGEEFAKFAARLEAAQARLDEHKSVRRDYEAGAAAEKVYGDLAARLAGIEVDCEKASMMAEPLARSLDIAPETTSAAAVREAKEALRVAQAALAPTLRLISGKTSGLKGPIQAKMEELKARAEAAQVMVDEAQRTVEESQARMAVGPLMTEALHRAEQVEVVLEQMRESEAPFLMGIETMPSEEADEALQAMDQAASAANTALVDALNYVSLKIVEVGRLPPGIAEGARGQLEKVKQQIDSGVERVRQFQADASKRRRANLVEVVKGKVEEAEAVVLKMKEAGGRVQVAETAGLPEALEQAMACELEAQSAVAAARRDLQAKQQDLRPLDGDAPDVLKSSSEVMRTKVRVQYMEGELAKFRKLARVYEEKIKVDRSLGELLASLGATEDDVEQLSASSLAWPEDARPPEEDERRIQAVHGKLNSTIGQVEMKLQNTQGLELKELRAIFGRLQKAQGKLAKVKDLAKQRSRLVGSSMVQKVADAVKQAETKVQSVSAAAKMPAQLPIERLEALNAEALEARALVVQALTDVAEGLAAGHAAATDVQTKVELARLQLRCKALERRGKALVGSVCGALDVIAAAAVEAVKESLREALHEDWARQDRAPDVEGFFNSLASGAAEVTDRHISDLCARRAGIGKAQALQDEQVRLALTRIAPHGLTRRAFANTLADFLRVMHEVALTDDFQVSTASKVRKLEVGEIVEAVGCVKLDSDLSLERVQCRALSDGASGWATVQSTQGMTYLQRTDKPFIWCSTAIALREVPSEGKVVRMLRPGEALELLEGPREESLSSDLRVRGVACDDEKTGWLQVRDKTGAELARLATGMCKCTEVIAMTDVADFENCTMTRRVDAGEALELLPDAPVTPSEGGSRRKFRACRDGREGWITTKGSQGTVYVKPAQRHYICVQAAPVHVGLGAESAVSKVLMPGEAFAAFEDPKEVAGGERLTTRRARAVADSAEGWVASSSALGEIQDWRPRYTVLKATPLTAAPDANEAAGAAEVIRLLSASELVDCLDQPVEDKASGQLRVRCVAVSDKASGWATVREAGSSDDPSSLLMRPATDEEDGGARASGAAAPRSPPGDTPSQSKGVKRAWEVKEEIYEDARPSKGAKGQYRPAKGGGKGGQWSYKGKSKW